ncbi:hypothetical protein BLNAU_9698 [Blattamonas nauphoetae]|uniref:Uncharacterized protein n=1 Tax=Blattamonas nauphoetae TaxID=2049346 RepID=A0ABQ9XUZ4_9EUKA|nr:hypothetical protein BLNAU_9698 [Blattamonas nauphoetae]
MKPTQPSVWKAPLSASPPIARQCLVLQTVPPRCLLPPRLRQSFSSQIPTPHPVADFWSCTDLVCLQPDLRPSANIPLQKELSRSKLCWLLRWHLSDMSVWHAPIIQARMHSTFRGSYPFILHDDFMNEYGVLNVRLKEAWYLPMTEITTLTSSSLPTSSTKMIPSKHTLSLKPVPTKRLSKVVELDFGVQKLNEAGRVDEETTRMRQNASALQPVQLDQQPLHELFSGVPQPSTQSSSLSAFPGTTPQAAHPSFYPGTTPMGTSHKCLSALCPTINRVPLSSATLSSEHILNSASPDSSYKPDSYFEHTRPQPQLSLLKPVVAAVRKPQYNILSLNTRVSYDSTLRPQQSPYVETSRKQQQFAEKQTTQSLITQLKTYLEQIQRITVNRKLLIALTLDMNDFEQFFNDSGYQNNMDQTNNGIESTLTLLSFLSPGLFFTKVKPKHNRTESGQSIIHKNLSFFHQQGPTTIYQESPQRCMLPNKHSRVEILSLHRYERPLARQLPHTMSIVWAPRTLTAGQLTPRQKPNRSPTSHSSSPDSVEMVPMDQHSHHTAPLPFHNQGDTHNECDAIYNPSPLLGQTILLRKQMNKRSGHSLLPTPTPPPRSGLCWPLLALS